MDTTTILCKFFNQVAGAHCWANSDETIKAVSKAMVKAEGDIEVIKAYLRERIAAGEKNFRRAIESFNMSASQPKVVEVEATPVAQVAQTAPTTDGLTASMMMLSQVVTELLAKTKLDDIRDVVAGELREDVKKFIFDTYGPITRKVEFQTPERKVQLEGIVHSKFEMILKFVQANEPVFLTGPAGSGKNVICQQVAKVLGLNFYFSNAVTQEYKLTGFTDANGTFHESQFYKAFKYGGVFMLDEMDASIPEVLIILNAAIANRYFDFPAPIGYVEAHKDFRVVAAGNTFGNGADYDYVGRNQLDAASLDRFAMVRVDYDAKIEEACANGDADLLSFCRKFRAATAKAGVRTVVSYRAISRMAKLSACMSAKEILDTCLIKSLEVDDLNAIKADVDGCGKWSAGFNSVLSDRKAGR